MIALRGLLYQQNLNSGKFACKHIRQSSSHRDQGDRVQRVFQVDEAAQVGGDVADGGSHGADAANGDEEAEVAAKET